MDDARDIRGLDAKSNCRVSDCCLSNGKRSDLECRARSSGLQRDRHWLVVAVLDIHHSAADEASTSFGVDAHRQGELSNILVVLRELNLLDEERRRFRNPAFRAHQAASLGVQIDVALEQANALRARL